MVYVGSRLARAIRREVVALAYDPKDLTYFANGEAIEAIENITRALGEHVQNSHEGDQFRFFSLCGLEHLHPLDCVHCASGDPVRSYPNAHTYEPKG